MFLFDALPKALFPNVGAKVGSKGSALGVNFTTFEGLGAFVKTVVSCRRNTYFVGWRAARTQTFCSFFRACF